MIEGLKHLRFTPEVRAPIGRYLTVTGLTRGGRYGNSPAQDGAEYAQV
jgi:hypothetical protein